MRRSSTSPSPPTGGTASPCAALPANSPPPASGACAPLPAYEPPAAFASPIAWRRTLEGKEAYLAPAVRGRFFRVERNDGSPAWLLRRLETAGAKAISPLVDLTNYFTFDLGRPLHVFDADKLEGDLTIRRARAGEALLALDENEYRLRENDLVIADGKSGGAGGRYRRASWAGWETGVTQATRRVFLEAALFDPETVALTARRLGIDSEARRRFERGVGSPVPPLGREGWRRG